MKAFRSFLIPLALIALPAGLAGCGAVTVEKSVEVSRPSEAVFAYLATAPAGTPFGAGSTLTIKEADANVVKGEIVTGDNKTPVEFSISEGPAGASVVARAQKSRFGGGDVETALQAGLDSFAADAQKLGTFDFGDLKFEVTDVAARPFLYIDGEAPNDAATIKSVVLQSVALVDQAIATNGLVPDGLPVAVETKWDEAQQIYGFQAGRPYQGSPPRILVAVRRGTTPGGTAIRVPYEGPEEGVIPVYDQIESLIAAGRLEKVGGSFEVYLDDPTQPGGSVKREIYHIVKGDAQRIAALFPNNKAPPAATPAPAPAAPAAAPAEATPAAATTP